MSTTSLKDIYLILYNNAGSTSWAMVWCMAVHFVLTHVWQQDNNNDIRSALASMYHHANSDIFSSVLIWSQGMAVLEIAHAGLGLVKSPVFVTTLQVMSRLVALMALYYSPMAQST